MPPVRGEETPGTERVGGRPCHRREGSGSPPALSGKLLMRSVPPFPRLLRVGRALMAAVVGCPTQDCRETERATALKPWSGTAHGERPVLAAAIAMRKVTL